MGFEVEDHGSSGGQASSRDAPSTLESLPVHRALVYRDLAYHAHAHVHGGGGATSSRLIYLHLDHLGQPDDDQPESLRAILGHAGAAAAPA